MQKITIVTKENTQSFEVIVCDESEEMRIEVLTQLRKQGKFFIVVANGTDVLYKGYNYTRVKKLFYNAVGYNS